MGGIQTTAGSKLARQTARACRHAETMSIIAAGLERILCETCGHLSFRWHEDLLAYIEREQTGAMAQAQHPVDTGLFALQTRFNIRSRHELHPDNAALAG